MKCTITDIDDDLMVTVRLPDDTEIMVEMPTTLDGQAIETLAEAGAALKDRIARAVRPHFIRKHKRQVNAARKAAILSKFVGHEITIPNEELVPLVVYDVKRAGDLP